MEDIGDHLPAVQDAVDGIHSTLITLSRGMSYVGHYNGATGVATFVPSMSSLSGPLPPANSAGIDEGDFLVVTDAGVGPPAVNVGDQLISGGPTGGPNWIVLPIGHSLASVTAATVPMAPVVSGWATVQAAVEGLNTRATAAGAVNQIQFNAGGTPAAFGASANFTFDGATSMVSLTGTGTPRLRVIETATGNLDFGIRGGDNEAEITTTNDLDFLLAPSGAITMNPGAAGLYAVWMGGAGGYALSIDYTTHHVGIGGVTNPAYPLHVAGDCNIAGTAPAPAYRINGIPLANANVNGTQINLTNVNSINGASPGGTPAGAVGQIQFQGGGTPTAFAASPNLFWDATNGRLGVHNAAPAYALDVTGAINCTLGVYVDGVLFAEPGSAHLKATDITGLDGEPLNLIASNGAVTSIDALLERLETLEALVAQLS